jgi:hypothetical protein
MVYSTLVSRIDISEFNLEVTVAVVAPVRSTIAAASETANTAATSTSNGTAFLEMKILENIKRG